MGETANTQARHIATVFPGRMTGSPAEMLSADYVRQQFAQMGYQSDIRSFHARYIYSNTDKRKNWQNVTGSTVIAAHEGAARQQIIVMAHLDTYAPMSDADVERNLGGLTLQGIDDNAVGVGVLLELAERLKNVSTHYGIRFIASSGEEEGNLGAQNILKRMSDAEKKNTLLVINLDNLVVGDKLYFNSGRSTPPRFANSPETALWLLRAAKGLPPIPILASIMIIRRAPAAVMTPAYLMAQGSRSCPWRPRTGLWVRKMALSNATNPPPSREEPAGMTYSWITSSILIKRCRVVSNTAAAMSSR